MTVSTTYVLPRIIFLMLCLRVIVQSIQYADAHYRNTECCYDECRHDEWHYALCVFA